MADPGGGGARGTPPIFGKYFKKSPELAKIYKKSSKQAPKTPGAPPPFSDPGTATDAARGV